jgi:hypothetical protein
MQDTQGGIRVVEPILLGRMDVRNRKDMEEVEECIRQAKRTSDTTKKCHLLESASYAAWRFRVLSWLTLSAKESMKGEYRKEEEEEKEESGNKQKDGGGRGDGKRGSLGLDCFSELQQKKEPCKCVVHLGDGICIKAGFLADKGCVDVVVEWKHPGMHENLPLVDSSSSSSSSSCSLIDNTTTKTTSSSIASPAPVAKMMITETEFVEARKKMRGMGKGGGGLGKGVKKM